MLDSVADQIVAGRQGCGEPVTYKPFVCRQQYSSQADVRGDIEGISHFPPHGYPQVVRVNLGNFHAFSQSLAPVDLASFYIMEASAAIRIALYWSERVLSRDSWSEDFRNSARVNRTAMNNTGQSAHCSRRHPSTSATAGGPVVRLLWGRYSGPPPAESRNRGGR